MKPFLSTVVILGCLAAFLLSFLFRYPVKIGLYHLISITILCATLAVLIVFFKLVIKVPLTAYLSANAIAATFWVFICFFYPIVLGSNHFWGNTITFEILKNYLTSFNSILSILPVEKWILIAVLIIYFLIVMGIFYLIRIKLSFFEKSSKLFNDYFPRMYFFVTLFTLILVAFFFRGAVMSLKRTMHFNQEPLLYFTFGPMWEVHSDQLLVSNHKNSDKDEQCINIIKKSSPKNKIAIIILLDALRSDHLPMYGYQRNTMPFLDSLYKTNQLILIKNSFSTSTNTIGGISGLFYSQDWDNFSYAQLNLMQYFQLSGYTTSAFLTGYHSGWYGLSAMYRGYCDNFYESTSAYHTAIDDDLVTLQKIESTPFTAGSFVFIHLLSTHTIGKRNKQFRQFIPDKIGLNTGYKEALINHYDNGILQGDYVIKKIFTKLQNENLINDATVFIVGDHGDLIGEDGLYGHSGGLHEKLLEVPILIYDHDTSWYNESTIASLKDVAPTLTDKVFGATPLCWQGLSLHKEQPSFYSTKVSASTVKTNLSQGTLVRKNDTIRLDIFNNNDKLQKVAIKIDSTSWKTVYINN